MIGTVKVDFTVIPDFSPDTLIIGDMSVWAVAEDKQASILITPPGSTKAISNSFMKHKLNIFNSENLGITCLTTDDQHNYINLSDGIWTINLQSSLEGLEKTRYYLKADQFRMDLDKIYIRAGLEYSKGSKKFREDLQDIEFLARTAAAHTRNGDFYKADRNFSEAKRLLDKYQTSNKYL
jgi:hypothetical protein